MQVIENDQVVCFDVDDTLVMWSYGALPVEGSIRFEHRKDKTQIFYLVPHDRHIEELKQHCINGKLVLVWSRGGHEWARTVIETLGLTDYVTLIMTKPFWYYDDIDANEFMTRVYHGNKKELTNG